MSAGTERPGRENVPYHILALDGGGAKGFYTLGVLTEVEALLGSKPLCENFDLVFGTSTGSIIAALLALGKNVDEIHALYKAHVPTVMRCKSVGARTEALKALARDVFGDATFKDFKTGIGIVATRWQAETPMIFKNDAGRAHGRKETFSPGFGCTIAQAVHASCSAFPYFEKAMVKTNSGDTVELIDGGYCANNPTLYSIADGIKQSNDLRVLSIGVGAYPEPKRWRPQYIYSRVFEKILGFSSLQLLQKTLDVNTASMEQLRAILFKEIKTVRVNDTFQKPELATDLLESDLTKLNLIHQEGKYSYGQREGQIRELLRTLLPLDEINHGHT